MMMGGRLIGFLLLKFLFLLDTTMCCMKERGIYPSRRIWVSAGVLSLCPGVSIPNHYHFFIHTLLSGGSLFAPKCPTWPLPRVLPPWKQPLTTVLLTNKPCLAIQSTIPLRHD